MSAFSSISRRFRFPASQDEIDMPVPANPQGYTSPFPRAPQGGWDAEGLRARIGYHRAITKVRDISPRLRMFVNKLKEDCDLLLNGKCKKGAREEMLRNVKINQDMLESKMEEVHGKSGLCDAITQSLELVAEVRLRTDYGDYMAISLAPYQTPDFDEYFWRFPNKKDWQAVSAALDEERKRMQEYHRRKQVAVGLVERPETPLMNDIEKAAEERNTTAEQFAFEIQAYAARNSYCHSGIKRLIDECKWHDLAERVLEDQATLNWVYRNKVNERNEMRRCIQTTENAWFDYCYRTPDGGLEYQQNAKAITKSNERQVRLRREVEETKEKIRGREERKAEKEAEKIRAEELNKEWELLRRILKPFA
ncbi:MAG: hypothetical protein M1812_006478 [Candelaria pacifica]|nr:MAG: hypothetical protein M1812_006478 [Candelaria pacifica]